MAQVALPTACLRGNATRGDDDVACRGGLPGATSDKRKRIAR